MQVSQLQPDTTYRLQIWAVNDKGASPFVHLRAFTTHPPTHTDHGKARADLDGRVQWSSSLSRPSEEDICVLSRFIGNQFILSLFEIFAIKFY